MVGTASATFNALLTAKDETGGVLAAIKERLHGIQVQAVRTGEATAAMAATANPALGSMQVRLAGLAAATHGVRDAMKSAHSWVTGMVPALGALAVPMSVAGLLHITKSSADAALEMDALVKKTGVSAREFGVLRAAAKMTGVPIEDLEGAMARLNKNMGEVGMGGKNELSKMAKALGVPLRNASGEMRNAAELLPDIAELMHLNENAAVRAAIGNTFLGKSYAKLLPMLDGGRDELVAFSKRLREVSLVPDPQAKKDLIEYARSYMVLETAANGLKTAIAGSLAPVLSPMLNDMAKWVAENRNWIASGIAGAVKDLAGYLKEVDWKSILEGGREFFADIKEGVQAVGGLASVLKILIGIKLAQWAGGAFKSLLGLLPGAGTAAAAAAGGAADAAAVAETTGVAGGVARLIAARVAAGLLGAAVPSSPAENMPPESGNPGWQDARKMETDSRQSVLDDAKRAMVRLWQDTFSDRSDEYQRLRRNGVTSRSGQPAWESPENFGGPSLPNISAAPALPAPPQRVKIDMNVRFDNAPDGLRSSVTISGPGVSQADVGVRMNEFGGP